MSALGSLEAFRIAMAKTGITPGVVLHAISVGHGLSLSR